MTQKQRLMNAARAGATGKWARIVEANTRGELDNSQFIEDCRLCHTTEGIGGCVSCPLQFIDNGRRRGRSGCCSSYGDWYTTRQRGDYLGCTLPALTVQFVLYALGDGAGDWSFLEKA